MGVPALDGTAATTTLSVTVVPGATVPCWLDVVVIVVEATTWKHSLATVVVDDPLKLPVAA